MVKDEISLKEMILSIQEWWKYIKTKWKVVLIGGVIGGVLGLVYSLVMPAKYVAEINFVLDNKKPGGDLSSIAAKFGLGSGSSSDGFFGNEDNIIVFLKSRRMGIQTFLSPLNSKELLIDRYIEAYHLREKWKDNRLRNIKFRPFSQPNSILADSIVFALHKTLLKKNLIIFRPESEADVISVDITSTDEEFSKIFVEKLMQNATEFYIKSVTKKSQDNVDVLQRQVDSVKQLLDYALRGAAITSDEVPNLNPAYQRLKLPTQKKIIDIEMNKAILEHIVVNLELAKINLRQETPFIQIIDSPLLPLEKKKTGKLKGIVLGGLISGLLIVVLMSLSYLYSLIIRN